LFPDRLLDVAVAEDRVAVRRGGEAGAAVQGDVCPRYLTTRDHIWVDHALETITAAVGEQRVEVERRLREAPSLGERRRAWQALGMLLLRLHGFEVRACRKPAQLRAELFEVAAASGPATSRAAIIDHVASGMGVAPVEVEQGLYADLPGERRLKALDPPLTTCDLIERYNLALAQSLLWRSESLAIRLEGHVKAVLRLARLRGLLCLAERRATDGETLLRLSGPLALFHHTTKYGHAMAAWLPVLIRAPRWGLEARCLLAGRRLRWKASCRDPIGTTHVPPRRFDSKLEARLFRDLKRLAPTWQTLRESDPVQVGSRIISPDFTLVDPDTSKRIPVEVIGFWTPEYLRHKLDVLRALPPDACWLLCVDSSLEARADCSVLARNHVFWFERRIDAEALLRFVRDHHGKAGSRGRNAAG
jgi:predicted nuclease of restriction endonuclease-like RecB superfamily